MFKVSNYFDLKTKRKTKEIYLHSDGSENQIISTNTMTLLYL